MPKLRKKVKSNEDKCKNMQKNMMLSGNIAKLEPRLFVIVDTDELQKQVNRLENKFYRLEKNQARNNWVKKGKKRR